MKKLHMTFLNEDGTKKTLVIHCVHQELSAEAVKTAMVQITELDLFEKDGVRLMTEVYSAKYVEVIETPLFDDNTGMTLTAEAVTKNHEETSDKEYLQDQMGEINQEPQKVKVCPFIPKQRKSSSQIQLRNNPQENFRINGKSNDIRIAVTLFRDAPNKPQTHFLEHMSARASP